MEPFRIKMVEPLPRTTREGRELFLVKAGYNVFRLPSRGVTIDLLTDSGTGAMSDQQWAAMLTADEAYAGSRSFERFSAAVESLFGFPEVIPTHQGRAAEYLLFSVLTVRGQHVPNNSHFDTTRANLESRGVEALDLLTPDALDTDSAAPFKGNMDLDALAALLAREPAEVVPFVLLTLTNNTAGGHPVSLANVRAVAQIARRAGRRLFLDAARIAENAYLIQRREAGMAAWGVPRIVGELCGLADGLLVSAKKDGLANIGGFLALRDAALAEEVRQRMVITEGFPTYGGLAGRDLDAIAVGLKEAQDEAYLEHRTGQVAYLAGELARAGIPVVQPPGGHAVYIDAARLLPHIPPLAYPGQALVVELYRAGGVRAVELGSVMFARRDPLTGIETPAPREWVRLALPRRVYTRSHLDYVAETAGEIASQAGEITGYRIPSSAEFLRHFTCTFEPLTRVTEPSIS